MLGMEMMISNLIGMTPDEIKISATKTIQLIEAAAKDMSELKASQLRIEEKLDTLIGEKYAAGRKQLPRNTGDNSQQ